MTRVLIAEDETIIRLDLRGLLESSRFEVCGEARDGVEAVELAAALEPDLILMDIKMPRLDGIEAARRILERRPVPIVMLTAFGQQELVTRAVETGVFGYLAKPFREHDVVPALVAARARYAELAAVRLQARSLAEALEARKAIERAKGILMAKEGISEEAAFARLRRASQRSGRPMKVIADAVAAALELAAEPAQVREQRRQAGRRDAHGRVGRAVVEPNGVGVVEEHPAAGEDDVADVPGPLVRRLRAEDPLGRPRQDELGPVAVEQREPDAVDRAGGGLAHAVKRDEPAILRGQRWRSEPDLVGVPVARAADAEQRAMVAPVAEVAAEREPDLAGRARLSGDGPVDQREPSAEPHREEGRVLVLGRQHDPTPLVAVEVARRG
jgi:response regulator NasT